MGQLEESSELTLDFTKLEKVGKQVSDTRAADASAVADKGVGGGFGCCGRMLGGGWVH